MYPKGSVTVESPVEFSACLDRKGGRPLAQRVLRRFATGEAPARHLAPGQDTHSECAAIAASDPPADVRTRTVAPHT